MRVRFADIAGARTRYYEAGDGYPIMLVHGVGVTSEIWLKNIEPLAQHFRVCAPDTLGSGLTGAGSYRGGAIHPHVVAHLLALADALGFEEFSAIGSSLGGLFAALLHLDAPQRVNKLVLTAAGSVFNDDAEYATTWRKVLENGGIAYADPTYENCMRRIGNVVAHVDSVPREVLLMQMTCYALPDAQKLFERRTAGMLTPDAMGAFRVADRLEQIAAPVLAVIGDKDPRVSVARAREQIGRFPDGRLDVFADCGHYPQLERAEEFNELVTDFLKLQSASAQG